MFLSEIIKLKILFPLSMPIILIAYYSAPLKRFGSNLSRVPSTKFSGNINLIISSWYIKSICPLEEPGELLWSTDYQKVSLISESSTWKFPDLISRNQVINLVSGRSKFRLRSSFDRLCLRSSNGPLAMEDFHRFADPDEVYGLSLRFEPWISFECGSFPRLICDHRTTEQEPSNKEPNNLLDQKGSI